MIANMTYSEIDASSQFWTVVDTNQAIVAPD